MTSVDKQNILVINSSVGLQGYHSNALTKEVVLDLIEDRPGSRCLYLNVGEEPYPYVNDEWVTANKTPEAERTDKQKVILELSNSLINKLQLADIIVVGCPVSNCSIPVSLKNYFDLICREGYTFKNTPSGPVGLLKGKRVVICTSGSDGDEMDFVNGHMENICGLIGLTNFRHFCSK